MLAALVFIPLKYIIKAFNEFVEYLSGNIMPLVNYCEDNFIGGCDGWEENQFKHKLLDLYNFAVCIYNIYYT